MKHLLHLYRTRAMLQFKLVLLARGGYYYGKRNSKMVQR
ncbi:hypothetical protein CU024_2229 [Enterococcus faecium]|nr:hypothetical protein [Enterococcus faecium]MBK4848342.1 hypothetical protein [Enterococcus faecium]MBK4871967.1 hypothetical protein [Enterococcus faecium]